MCVSMSKFVDKIQLSKILGCSVGTIDKMRSQAADFPCVKLCTRVVFDAGDVLRWLKARGGVGASDAKTAEKTEG